MSRQLYEEAIADAKQIQSVAEDNAKRAIIEAVTPRIRALIERNLMESPGDGDLGDDSDEDILMDGDPTLAGMDPAGEDGGVAAAISPPGIDGKVTLDLDGLAPECEPALDGSRPAGDPAAPGAAGEDFVLNAESLAALEPILAGTDRFSANEVELQTYRLGESIARFSRAGRLVRSSKVFGTKIDEMITRVKNTYECVQESVKDPARKRSLEMKLEAFNRALGRLTEMSKQRRGSRVHEGDVTLKLTGLPDELDLDGVGVDLIKDDEDGDEGGDLDLDSGDDGGGDDGGDLDLDAGGDGDGDEGDIKMGEGRRLGDDTVVEIDESMLRREISRMRSVREEAVPSTKGHAPRGSELDDFGGGDDEGDPWLDSDVPKGGLSLKIVGESDEGDEGDEVLEIDMGGGEPPVEECDDMPMESARRRLPGLREAIRRARRTGDARKLAEATAAYRRATRAARTTRGKRITGGLAEARTSRSGARSNSGPRRTTTEGGAAERNLRMQLMQSNLRNAKLTATAKLLQNESLSARQRADIVEQLESAKSPREVKLIYGSLTSTLARSSKPLSESAGRRVMGSSSRVTRPASTVLNESTEAARWAQLAGIR